MDEIKEKTQLKRFLGSLNYLSELFEDLSTLCAPLRQRLKTNHVTWTAEHTKIVRAIKIKTKTLPCLCIADPDTFKIVETDTSEIGNGGILKQKIDNKEQLVRYTSGTWNQARSK